MKNNDILLDDLFFKYKLTKEEKKEFFYIIKDIYNHHEFKKRMKNNFLHHGKTTLGMHILQDAILTYKLSKKINDKNYDTNVAVIIAMLHDLYTSPWQNSTIKNKHFFNKHGFRHPIEACINAINWFPNLFNDINKANKIIDGIIHHMYPLPVTQVNNIKNNDIELQNFKYIKNLTNKQIDMIIKSTNRGKIGKISLAKSKYKEGRIMSKADKIVSIKQFNNISDFIALLTGKNKKLK